MLPTNLDEIKWHLYMSVFRMYRMRHAMDSKFREEFENWFWKIRPYLTVDLTKYSKDYRVYDTDEDSKELVKVEESVNEK